MLQHGDSSLLPLRYRYGNKLSSGKKIKEVHCLAIILATFIFAWISLTMCMPAIQHIDASFKVSYSRFAPRSVLSDQNNVEVLDSPGDLSLQDGGINVGGHISVKRDIESSYEQPPADLNSAPSKLTATPESVDTPENVHKEDVAVVTYPAASKVSESVVRESNLSINENRKEKVKEMIKHAWDGYVKFAFGENELKPISKVGHSAGVFGKTKMGATIVDSLDTLYIAGLMEEFEQAKNWVNTTFHIDQVNTDVSLFEFNIRFVGGFLSAYALSGDKMFIGKAKAVIDRLLPAFNTATGLPKSLVNLKTGSAKNWKWAAGGSSVLSEVGSLHLEFQYLSEVTGDPVYINKVLKIRNKLREMARADNLYSNFMSGDTGRWTQKYISLGALGDSFYEYLIKSWLVTSKKDTEGLDMFTSAVKALEPILMQKKKNGLVLVTDQKSGRSDGKMQHLACFSGGMFALASQHIKNDQTEHYLELASGITGMCHASYARSATHLGPEAFRIDSEGSVISRSNEKMYMLRPETVESYFYMWRLTGDQKYREWGWEFVEALEMHCRVPHGYSGIRDVFKIPPVRDDVQQSFFIAETLKYLYLLFSDDSVISLDQWVFNTEAHPLPILPDIPSGTSLL